MKKNLNRKRSVLLMLSVFGLTILANSIENIFFENLKAENFILWLSFRVGYTLVVSIIVGLLIKIWYEKNKDNL